MIQNSLNPNLNPAPDTEPGYGQLFAILIRRFPWFLVVFSASIAIAGAITERTPPKYKSSMELLIEPNYQGKGQPTDENKFSDPSIEVDTATQLKLMQSSGLIQKAVDRLKPKYNDITVDEIKQSLSLTQLKEPEDNTRTKIIQAEYQAVDPNKTQDVLYAVKEVYQNYNIEQQRERLQRGLKVIQEQLNQAERDVANSQKRLEKFRRSQNLINPEQQAKALEEELRNIQQERRTTRNQYEEAKASFKSVQAQLNRTPQNALVSSRLTQSPRYQSLLNEIQKTELAKTQLSLRFTSSHPDVVKFQEQLKEQKQLLQQEVRRALGGQTQGTGVLKGDILDQGQLGKIDIDLAASLAQTQTNILALAARDRSLANKELQLRNEVKRFPVLLAKYSLLQPQVERTQERYENLLRAKQELRQELSN